MDDKTKKNIKILIVIFLVCLLLTIGLLLVKKSSQKEKKVLEEYSYLIEKETDFSSNVDKGLLPIINLKGSDIEKINEEIITKYYEIAYTEYDIFRYEYYVHDDILSILITLTYVDNTEYGKIEYYSYNINTKTNKSLSKEELLEYLNIDLTKFNNNVENRIKEYYNQDTLKDQINYREYKEALNFNESNERLVVKDQKIYCYISLNVTKSLITYQGNINEIEVIDLK